MHLENINPTPSPDNEELGFFLTEAYRVSTIDDPNWMLIEIRLVI